MRRLPPTSTRTDTPFPYTTRVRSRSKAAKERGMTDFTDEELALDPNFADRFEQGFRPACQLYLISPPAIGADFADRMAAAFDGGGVAAFQLRLKGLDEDAVARAAEPLQKLYAERDVDFIVNEIGRATVLTTVTNEHIV